MREKLARGGEGVAVRRTFGTVGGEPLRLSVKEGDGVARAADAAVGRATSRRGFGCFTGGGGFAGSTGDGGTGGGASSNGVISLSMTTSAGLRGSRYLVSKGGLSRAFGMPAYLPPEKGDVCFFVVACVGVTEGCPLYTSKSSSYWSGLTTGP